MNFFKSKVFLISVAVALALALITGVFAMLGFAGPIKAALGTVAKPFEHIGSWAANAVNGFVEVFTDYDRLKAENDALRAALSEKEDESYNAEVLREENEWLKEYINFAGDHKDFELTGATVVARESNNYSTILTLNRGSVHGVKTDMPVITENGTFGHVVEVGLDWCRVVSLVAPENSVGAAVERNGVTGIVTGDIAYAENGLCRMSYIDGDADLRIGDRIYTSGGAGSAYPAGLLIGTVSVREVDADTRTLVATVTPAVDFTDVSGISKVMIVTGYGEGTSK